MTRSHNQLDALSRSGAAESSRQHDLGIFQTSERELPLEGVTTSAVRGLFGNLPMPRPARVAVIGCCIKEHFPFATACASYDTAFEIVSNGLPSSDFTVLRAPQPFEHPADALQFAQHLLREPLAGVIFLHATYTAGEMGAHFGRWLADHNMPVLSWSYPDARGGRLDANSLCCQNFLLNMWSRLGVRYAWLHESLTSAAQPTVNRFLRSIRARDRLRHSRVLHAGGSRVTGFYDGEADELAVMRRFGVQFDRVDLQEVASLAQQIAAEDVDHVRETLLRHVLCTTIDVPDEQVDKTLRFGLAIYKLAVEQGYAGCTVKSWPEMFSCYGCAIDGAISLLNDAGVCAAEEGDMCALLTSLAVHHLTNGMAVPITMDLTGLDVELNRIGVWHCGACPTRTLKRGATFEARKHSILEHADSAAAYGLVLEFLLELGPATIARYQAPDAGRMLKFEGRLVEAEMAYRGSYGEFEPDAASASQILGTILSAGLDHHWSVGYGRHGEDLAMLNHWLGVEDVPLIKSASTHGLSRLR